MLELKNVCAGYGGADVLHHISCSFSEGGSYCLLGPNGCGKTTLLRVLSGLLPYRGHALLDGIEIAGLRRKQLASRMAMLSQIHVVQFPYTVYDTVLLGRYRHMRERWFGRPSLADKEVVERCLEVAGLSDLRHRMLNELSDGQLQRAFLAHTLAQEPDIILLDEPTNHLDIRQQVELIDYLNMWSSENGHTVIGVLHDVNLALRLSRRVLFMREGCVLRQGEFSQIADDAFLQCVYDMNIGEYMRSSLQQWSIDP